MAWGAAIFSPARPCFKPSFRTKLASQEWISLFSLPATKKHWTWLLLEVSERKQRWRLSMRRSFPDKSQTPISNKGITWVTKETYNRWQSKGKTCTFALFGVSDLHDQILLYLHKPHETSARSKTPRWDDTSTRTPTLQEDFKQMGGSPTIFSLLQ